MARTKISLRLEREAQEAEASGAGGGEDEGDAGSGEDGGVIEEEDPAWKGAHVGSSDSEADGGAAQRSGGGGGGGGSGEGQDQGEAVDIKMGDGDEGEQGRAKEGEQARELGDVVTPRNFKRAAPEIELSKAVSKKQKNALPSDIEGIGGPPPTRKELVACVQDHVDNEEAVDSLREAISALANVQNLLHKLLDTQSGTGEKLAKQGQQQQQQHATEDKAPPTGYHFSTVAARPETVELAGGKGSTTLSAG